MPQCVTCAARKISRAQPVGSVHHLLHILRATSLITSHTKLYQVKSNQIKSEITFHKSNVAIYHRSYFSSGTGLYDSFQTATNGIAK